MYHPPLNSNSEEAIVKKLLPLANFDLQAEQRITAKATELIKIIRQDRSFSIERFLQQYNLATQEGVAILALAEGLLRIPDLKLSVELAVDKLADKQWYKFLLSQIGSIKLTISAFGLFFCGKFSELIQGNNVFARSLKNITQPAFIQILRASILYLSREFVFANNMQQALSKSRKYTEYQFSFDLLGESARDMATADIYYQQYIQAIALLAKSTNNSSAPSLSVKFTALHPRFELAKIAELEQILLPKIVELIAQSKQHQIAITFDAEESWRTDIYFGFIEKILTQPICQDFHKIGVVIQAYQTRALSLVKHTISLAKKLQRQIPVRLVKGAYWDSEIKHAQELAVQHYPVFTKKAYTDLSYTACARLMLEHSDELMCQFATHNAYTIATILELAQGKKFELQKLHGMGNVMFKHLSKNYQSRIYAPVGITKDLLAYLLRRMLENGASANFVSKVNSSKITTAALTKNVADQALSLLGEHNQITLPENLYPNRKNAMGYDLGFKNNYDYIQDKVASYFNKVHQVGSIINGKEIIDQKKATEQFCPAYNAEKFAATSTAIESEIKEAFDMAVNTLPAWQAVMVDKRADILRRMAILLEQNKFELYALLIKEAGKSIHDAIAEVIEAVDFCRYYANCAEEIMRPKLLPGPTGEKNSLMMHGRGVFLCISPWNFPLAIFTGQIVAALVAGNTVLAKPAAQTTVIANYAIKLLHKAGVPLGALQLIITSGSNISRYGIADPRVAGVVFTGSCATAQKINQVLAEKNKLIPLIAETGGQNAMVVDSSALLEQVVDDVLMSAFLSAGQRCSALRMLYVQEEIYQPLLEMLKGATEALSIGDTADFSYDIGPVIDQAAQASLQGHIEYMQQQGFKIFSHPQNGANKNGYYFYPHIIEVNSINDIPEEQFGPILHIASYKAENLSQVIEEINAVDYGLTFGIHSRIESKIDYLKQRIKVGNIYVNRSITGAKVESQPFGGENKSGTGFKAGGPHYLLKFLTERTTTINTTAFGGNVELLNNAD